jgi:hypothetical protein
VNDANCTQRVSSMTQETFYGSPDVGQSGFITTRRRINRFRASAPKEM